MKVLTIDALYGLGAASALDAKKGEAYESFQATINAYYAWIDQVLAASRAGAITPAESDRLQSIMDAAIYAAEEHNSGQLFDTITTEEGWAAWEATRILLVAGLEAAKAQVSAALSAAGVSVESRPLNTFWIALGTAVIAGGLTFLLLRKGK